MHRLSLLGKSAAGMAARRGFSRSCIALDAKNFAMPAMSPTMVEGAIVQWHFKEGDSFSSGDVLLEIETDKAQIDVEAQDDGKLAKIYDQNGAKGIPVGKTIAVIAELEDDLSSLELPAPVSGGSEVSKPSKEPSKEASKETPAPPKEKPTPKVPKPASEGGVFQKANPSQTLLPSVQVLLGAHGISPEDALSKIPASGPKGRLLKGDVLTYLGTVSSANVEALVKNITNLQHLDLSNIKATSTLVKPAAESDSGPAEKSAPEPIVYRETVSLGELNRLQESAAKTLHIPLSVESLVEKASSLALQDVPLFSKPARSVLYDPVFEDLITKRNTAEPFTIEIEFPTTIERNVAKSNDILSILTKKGPAYSVPRRKIVVEEEQRPEFLEVTVTVNEKATNGDKKTQIYLDRFEYYLTEGVGDLIL